MTVRSDFDGPAPRRRPAQQFPMKKVPGLVVALIFVVVTVGGLLTSWTRVEPGMVAVIKNNVTRGETVQTASGLVFHLPFGLTDVFLLNRKVQVFTMTKDVGRGDLQTRDNVKIKVADGSNVEADVEVNFKIIPVEAAHIIRRVGPDEAFKNKMIRSYTRALIREQYGLLTLEAVSDPATRTSQNVRVKEALNESLRTFGIEVTQVNTTRFVFNKEYERLVKEKKATSQEFTNQSAAQEKAQKEQEAKIASATRTKNTTIIQARGVARKRIVTVENEAKQLIARAGGQAYAKRKEGERSFEVATNEARAIEAEGLNTAQGIKRLADAYARGGVGLVKEAIARKLLGKRINGRPYSLSEKIERFEVKRDSAIPAATGNREEK